MKKQIISISVAVLLLAGVVIALFYFYERKEVAQEPMQKISVQAPSIEGSNIKNLSLSVVAIKDYISKYSNFYRIVVKHPQEITYASTSMVIGYLQAEYGDGSSPMHIPFLLKDNVAYVVNGYGGTAYPMRETNWKTIYKNGEWENFEPLDHFFTDTLTKGVSTMDIYNVYRSVAGVEKISVTSSIDEIVNHVSVISGGKTFDIDGPFVTYPDFEIVKIAQNSGTVSEVENSKRTRILAGVTGASESYYWKYGQVSYPITVDGLYVTPVSDSQNNLSFHVSDEPYEKTVGYVDCSEYPSEEVGPEGSESLISSIFGKDYSTKIKSWGYADQVGFDVISFTTDHEHCQFRVSGRFRLPMFSFDLEKRS